MNLIDSVVRSFNYGTTIAFEAVNRVVSNPSMSSKVLKIASKSIEAFNFYHGGCRFSEVNRSINGAVDLIGLYETFSVCTYWIPSFSKETLDQEVLIDSLEKSLSRLQQVDPKQQTQIIKKVKNQKDFYSAKEVKTAVEEALKEHQILTVDINSILTDLIVRKKANPILKTISVAFTTIATLGDSLSTLDRWKVINLAQLAALSTQLGRQAPALLFVINLGLANVVGITDSVGNLFLFIEAAHRAIHSYRNNGELKTALIDMATSAADCVSGAAPLLFALNPSMIIALAIAAKGVGCICFFVR